MVQGWRAKDPMKSIASPACCKTQLCGSSQGPGGAEGRIGRHSTAWPDPAGASGDGAADGKGGSCQGGRSKRAKAQGTPPQKVLHVNSNSGKNKHTTLGMERARWPTKKKAPDQVFYTLQYFFLICCSTAAEAFQNWFTLLCLKDVGIIPMQQE